MFRPNHLGNKGSITRAELDEEIDYVFQDREEKEMTIAWNSTGIEHIVKIDFIENIDIYIENLSNLGLIKFERGEYNLNDADVYQLLEEATYEPLFDKFSKIKEEKFNNGFMAEVFRRRGYILYIEYGKSFIEACIK